MNRLRAPLANYLSDEVSEASLHGVWQRVRKRRLRRGRPRLPQLAWVALAATVLVLCVSWLRFAEEPGPLAIEQGGPPRSLGGPRPERVVLSDGSAIELGEQAALEVLSNDRDSFVTVLRRGRGTFDVKPGGSRRWRIEAGPVEVEVVGTRFTVERSEDQVFVHVERGAVLVRGSTVPDRVQRLNAGAGLVVGRERPAQEDVPLARPKEAAEQKDVLRLDELDELDEREAAAAPATDSRGDSARIPVPPTPAPAAPEVSDVPEEHASSTPAAPGDAMEVAAPLEGTTASVPGTATDDLAELLRTADRQRLDGDTAAAIVTLRAIVKQTSYDPRRALAAFTLAKLLVDRGQLLEAEAALRTCLSMQPGRTLAENAWARLVEVQLRSGQPNAARQSAQEYARRYPDGQRLKELMRLTEERRF